MEDYNKEKDIKDLKEINAFFESMTSLHSAEKRKLEIKEFFQKIKTKGYIDEDFNETDENRSLKSQYLKASIIYDDLNLYNNSFKIEKGNLYSICKILQATKNSFLPLALLRSNINSWSRYHSADSYLNTIRNKILPGLEFANHVRNKIAGHIENEVIENAVQWEPMIFQDSIKNTGVFQRFLLYRSILESAINSYIDTTGKHKIFKQEIDIVYPETSKLFYTYHIQLIMDSLEYLRRLKTEMNTKIIYFHGLPANFIKSPGETEFKTKSKGR